MRGAAWTRGQDSEGSGWSVGRTYAVRSREGTIWRAMSIFANLVRREGEGTMPRLKNHADGDCTMRYMMIVKGDENFAASGPPPMELMEEIGKLGEEAAKTGKMVSMGGLQHSSKGATVRIKGGKIVTTDGPFTEAKEIIGGFTILNLESKEQAIEEAVKFME